MMQGKERTLSIIKPDATSRNINGEVLAMIEKAGLRIVAQKRVWMTQGQAAQFYAVHSERPFFGDLVEYMSSGPVTVQVLEGDNAVARYRDLMGETDPQKASVGTIRAAYGKDIQYNTVHGSDSNENAQQEINFFFSFSDIVG